MRSATLTVLLALAVVALAGYGFHLRGHGQLAATRGLVVHVEDNTRVALTGSWLGSGPDELAHTLKDVLEDAGVQLADSAPLTVELLGETMEKRVASIAATAGAAEYQLDYTLRFRVTGSDGADLVKESTVRADRSYRYKSDAIMGSAEEEATLQRELRRDAALQILRRLRSVANRGNDHAPQP